MNNKECKITRHCHIDLDGLPNDFCAYMKSTNTRFNDICDRYLIGLTFDDIKYLQPDDLINIVPENKHRDKLLMTIMVRKYLYQCDDNDSESNDIN
tara:strand:- start:573 stop:860 length:288 start_codon:yes stop_codon:yes gene_type:complete